MIRRPPRSPLFPYTPLSRSVEARGAPPVVRIRLVEDLLTGCPRSEEHTSELQSHLNLVCRLLLEKKSPSTTPTNGASCNNSSARASRRVAPTGAVAGIARCSPSFFFEGSGAPGDLRFSLTRLSPD